MLFPIVLSHLAFLAILTAGVVMLNLGAIRKAIAPKALPLALLSGNPNMMLYSTCLMTLAERLEAMGYTLYRSSEHEWLLLEEPLHIIKIHSLSGQLGDFVAAYGVKHLIAGAYDTQAYTTNYLPLLDWLDRLEYIAMGKSYGAY